MIGAYFKNEALSIRGACGIALTVIGSSLYSFIRYKEQKSAEDLGK